MINADKLDRHSAISPRPPAMQKPWRANSNPCKTREIAEECQTICLALPSGITASTRMTYDQFRSWLEAYRRAWETRDPQTAASLFAEDGTYQENPFAEPMRGRRAIADYWSHVALTQEQVQFRYEILAVKRALGIARWWASFVRIPSKTQIKLDGIFAVSLDGENRCWVFREWWHKQEKKAE